MIRPRQTPEAHLERDRLRRAARTGVITGHPVYAVRSTPPGTGRSNLYPTTSATDETDLRADFLAPIFGAGLVLFSYALTLTLQTLFDLLTRLIVGQAIIIYYIIFSTLLVLFGAWAIGAGLVLKQLTKTNPLYVGIAYSGLAFYGSVTLAYKFLNKLALTELALFIVSVLSFQKGFSLIGEGLKQKKQNQGVDPDDS